jgi:NAD(P)-dependent dehydrogenase (short-subunit alcohol dehydrogenase family)
MSGEELAPLVRHQEPAAAVEDVAPQLGRHFAALREALSEGRAVVFVVSEADLLGQRATADAAVANGLLGLARAAAMEGARKGWTVNVVSDGGDAAALAETLAWLAAPGPLSGQLIRGGTSHLGRVPV